jgi:uncharacterized protein YmfQ (DUF2313 family)
MARTVADYLAALQALLPSGYAWPRDAEATLTKLLDAWAEGLARVDGRADDLADEADPRTAFEMLVDWERVCGLPDGCSDYEDTLAQRRQAVLAKLAARGGQSPAYFVALAQTIGYRVTLEEFRPFTTRTACDQPICDAAWAFAWRLRAPAQTVRPLTTAGTCAERLAAWGNEKLECLLAQVAPGHTTLLFAYGG